MRAEVPHLIRNKTHTLPLSPLSRVHNLGVCMLMTEVSHGIIKLLWAYKGKPGATPLPRTYSMRYSKKLL